MKRTTELPPDMMTLARMHAALDGVVETEQLLQQIRETSAMPPTSLAHVAELMAEAREVLRWLLASPDRRDGVGDLVTRRRAGAR